MRQYILSLLAGLFLIGCSPKHPPIDESKTLHYAELERFIVSEHGMRSSDKFYADSQFFIVNEDWVKGEFAPSFNQFLLEFRKKYAKSGISDCDNFAFLAANFANFLHTSQLASSNDVGIAFGVIGYPRDMGGGHAVNLIIVGSKEKPDLLFFEPQTGKFVNLSKKEKEQSILVSFQ